MFPSIHRLTQKFRAHPFIQQNPQVKEMIKYAIVGNVSNVIDFGLYIYLTRAFSYWRDHYLDANIFTILIAGIVRFTWHKKWTFRDQGREVEVQLFKFITIIIISAVINQLILYLSVEYLTINDIIGKLIASLLTTLLIYYGSKIWVFERKIK